MLLNNEMDDFSCAPTCRTRIRLRGSDANAVAPGKRPLSSMTPAFVEDGKGVLVLGAPGGSRIVSQVLLGDTRLPANVAAKSIWSASCGAPRYHHQWWPDRVEVEPEAFPPEWRAALEAKGHRAPGGGAAVGQHAGSCSSRSDRGTRRRRAIRAGHDVGWY